MNAESLILFVDDHELLRVGLRSMLASMNLVDVRAIEAGSLQAGMDLYEKHAADINLVVLDLNLPDSKGLSALRIFKQRFPSARIVVLSGSGDAAISEEARVLGAESFLHKAGDLSLVGQLFRTLPAKSAFMSATTVALQDAARKRAAESPERMRLSSREVEILDLVLQGRSNQEIADSIDLRLGTVKNYISGLFVVFGVSSRSKLISLFR
jgi:DNA-binding NarL/FixJ family response regulator